MQKAAVCGKDLSAIIIEAENHPGPHLHPGVLDATDLLSDAAATTEVLKLLRFAQRVLIGAFDANEDDADIGCRHQLHQFVIVGEVNRRLGHERQREPVHPLPIDDVVEDSLDSAFVADKVVVNDEDDRQTRSAQRLKLGDNLR